MSISPDPYLSLVGYINPQNQVTLLPGFTTPSPDSLYDQAMKAPDVTIITARMLDPKGGTLLEYKIPALPFHGDPGATYLNLRTTIPFPQGTSAVNFLLNGSVIYTLKVPPGSPSAKITWQPPNGPVTGKQTITWEGAHSAGLPLYYLLAYSPNGGKSFLSATLGIRDPQYVLDFDQLPGGTGQLQLLATDGVNTIRVPSPTFSVPIKPCYAMILAPHDGATVPAKTPLWLEGQGYYREEVTSELKALSWFIDGQDSKLQGNLVVAPGLAPGTHEIALYAGTPDRLGKAVVTVTAQ